MKPFLVVISCLMLVTTALLAQDKDMSLSLRECIDTALKNSTKLSATSLEIEKSRADLREANSDKRGTVDLSATAVHISEVMESSLNVPTQPGVSKPKIKFGDGNSIDMQAGIKIPLYSGGALTSRSNALKIGVDASIIQASTDSLDIRYEVETVFLAALGLESKEKAIENSIERLNRHKWELEQAQASGFGTKEMLLAIESRIMQVRNSLEMVKAESEKAKLNLGFLIGMPGIRIVPKSDSISLEAQPIREESGEQSLEEKPEMKAISARLEQLEAARGVVKAAYLPTAGLTFAYHYGKPGINAIENDWMGYYNAGVSVGWTIWDWGSRGAQTEKARIQERELYIRKKQLTDVLTVRIKSATARLRHVQEAASIAEKRHKIEQERQSLLESRFILGAATESELLDGEDDLTIAETDLIDAQIQCRLAYTEYQRATALHYPNNSKYGN